MISIIEKAKAWWLKRQVRKLGTEGFNPAVPDLSKISQNFREAQRRKAVQDRFAPSRKHLDSKRGIAFIERFQHNPCGSKNCRCRRMNIQGFTGRQAA
jgi:hypothetical protein